MAAPWHLIEEKVEDAFAAALLTEYGGTVAPSGLVTGGDFDGYRLLVGFGLDEIVPPYISIIADESEPAESALAIPTGNQNVMVKLRVCSHFGDGATRSAHSAIAAKVKDFAYADNLAALLVAAGVTDFSVDYTFPQQTRRTVEDSMICTETTVRVRARPS